MTKSLPAVMIKQIAVSTRRQQQINNVNIPATLTTKHVQAVHSLTLCFIYERFF